MLTRQQRALLAFIHQQQTQHGITPSYPEMARGIGLNPTAKGNINRLVKALVERGFVTYRPNRARSVEILRMPADVAPIFTPSSTARLLDALHQIAAVTQESATRAIAQTAIAGAAK